MHGSRITVTFLVSLIGSTALADQVTLKNGDRITGEIIKKDEKAITVKSEFIGTVAVPWEQIQTVKSDVPLTLVLQSGEQLKATLVPAEGKVELREQQRIIEPGQVTVIRNSAEQAAYERLDYPHFYNLWNGNGAVGLSGTNGNAQTRTLTAALSAARVTRRDKTSLHFDAIKANSVGSSVKSDTAQAVRGGVAYDRNITKRAFVNFFNDYEYDKFQNLDLRATFGIGIGLHAWVGKRGFLDLPAGVDYTRSKFGGSTVAAGYTQSAAEFFYGDDFSFRLRPSTSFTQSFRNFHNLTQTGNYRANADIGLNTRIMKWLTWNIAASDRYLSNPAPGRKTNDIIYTTGLGITFSVK